MRRFTVAILMVFLSASSAMADGGLLRLSEQRGDLRVGVFTSPTPPRPGTIDISVLVQDAKGRVRLGVPVLVRAWPVDDPGSVVQAKATRELATNQLLQSAHLQLDRPGGWRLVVQVEGVDFICDLELAEPSPSWHPLLPWVGWPFLVVVLFLLRFFLARREPSPTRRV